MYKQKIVRKNEQENKLDDGNETGIERDRKKDKRKTSTRTLKSKRDQDTVEGRFTARAMRE